MNSWSSFKDLIVIAPRGDTWATSKGPDHLNLSFPGNSLSLDLNRGLSARAEEGSTFVDIFDQLVLLGHESLSWHKLP
ncbi:hypothetical protein V6N13_101310 [Hibiscus sabdariffa]